MQLLFLGTLLMVSLSLTQARPEANPKAEAKPGLLSVVEKSTTHLPNHFSAQVSAYNVDPSVAYPDLYGAYPYLLNLPYLNRLPHHSVLPRWGDLLHGKPYLRNYLTSGYGGLSPHLLSYSLAPDDDLSWLFLNGYPFDTYAFNNLFNLHGPYGSTIPYSNPLYSAYGRLHPALLNSNLSALDRFKLNAKLHADDLLYSRPGLSDNPSHSSSLLKATGIHNTNGLGKSKEVDYKKDDRVL
ncbi:uncharacterized protein LOC108682720 [Hyalella azteca]|uniref:Uncharacterized protein LOC108682720 n=1 Tax=Hyalella azteca TaxID=294128 RepID=A0A8B7PN87_HYAAZ|nr:uncharacterized protein LOC108682720 [Hyalella azteca]